MKYIIEHLEQELTEWTTLEYMHMQSRLPPGSLIISGVSDVSSFPKVLQPLCKPLSFLQSLPQSKVLLLDPKAETGLEKQDGDTFEYLLFGGILGTPLKKSLHSRYTFRNTDS